MNPPESFSSFLLQKGYRSATICQHERYALQYLAFISGMEPQAATYNDVLAFAETLRLEGNSVNLINRKLLSIRHYYKYLQHFDRSVRNPASGIRIRGSRRKVVGGLIPFEELEILYQDYVVTDNRSLRNKAILGLIIYQGLTADELKRLEVGNLNLREGKVQVPGSRHSNGRILTLMAHQILDLQQYLLTVRPAILNEPTDQLFVSMEGSLNIKASLLHLFKALKKLNPSVINAGLIRQSVIAHWLKSNNLRQVQYIAGHRYVSSTERYKASMLEDLKKQLSLFHPLKNGFEYI
ncbi:MAG: tyrosine-type recombinase/integrase [Bacteroidetes bacterium]|nr:tyrosine-type recombinase/integrase [Bacteroidota bacterium]